MGNEKNTFFQNPRDFFSGIVAEAIEARSAEVGLLTSNYIVDLLQHYVNAENLFEEDETGGNRQMSTLAELYLKAGNSPIGVKLDLYKRLGDTSLYISGFFGDSLNRKLVDIDYYADMGGNAYGSLSSYVKDDTFKSVYSELSNKFIDFVEILTHISQKTLGPPGSDVLRLYEKYVLTGSGVAREQLVNQGVFPPNGTKKIKSQ